MKVHAVRLITATPHMLIEDAEKEYYSQFAAIQGSMLDVVPVSMPDKHETKIDGHCRIDIVDKDDQFQILTDQELISLVVCGVRFEHINTRDLAPATAIKSQGSIKAAQTGGTI